MVKKIFITISIFSCILISADEIPNLKTIDVLGSELSIEKDTYIYTLAGNFNNLKLKKKRVAKPSKESLKLLKAVTPRDKYAIRVLDENNREIMLIGIGDPFYVHADHIGYEDSNVFGGYIETELDIPISLNKKVSQIILLSQSEFGFKEIKKLNLK